MNTEYRDRWIECTGDELRIQGYYFPWGTKRIPYRQLRSVRTVRLSATRGRARIWGTANPRYWASLDQQRPGKRVGLVLDTGSPVHPFITPADPEAVRKCIRNHSDAQMSDEGDGPAPIV